MNIDLIDYFAAHVSSEEVDKMIPTTPLEVLKFIDFPNVGSDYSKRGYDYKIHYPMAIAKARYMIARAMLEERKNHSVYIND